MAGTRLETLEQKIARVLQDHVAIAPYDPGWPRSFEQERDHLLACLPNDLIRRIEHFGSTAVPGLAAKPIVDMLVEVADLESTKQRIAPVLEAQGYDYFWRATSGETRRPSTPGSSSATSAASEPITSTWSRRTSSIGIGCSSATT